MVKWRQFVYIVSIIVDFIGSFHVSRQFDQCSRLEHCGQCAFRRMPCGIADNFNIAFPQDRFRTKQKNPGSNVIVTGDNRNLFHLWICWRELLSFYSPPTASLENVCGTMCGDGLGKYQRLHCNWRI